MKWSVDEQGRICITLRDGVEVDIQTAVEMISNLKCSKSKLQSDYESLYSTHGKLMGKETRSQAKYEQLQTKYEHLQKTFNEQNTCLGEHEQNEAKLVKLVKSLQERLGKKCNLVRKLANGVDVEALTKENEVLKESLCAASTKIIDQAFKIDELSNKVVSMSSVSYENETLRNTIKKVSAEILQKALDLNIRECELKEAHNKCKRLLHDIQNLNFNYHQRGHEITRMRLQLRKAEKNPNINKRCEETLRLTRNYVSELEEDKQNLRIKIATLQSTDTWRNVEKLQGKISQLELKLSTEQHITDKQDIRIQDLKSKLVVMTSKKNHFKSELHRLTYQGIFTAVDWDEKHKQGSNPFGNCRCVQTPVHPHQTKDEHFKGYDEGELDITILAIIEIDNTQE